MTEHDYRIELAPLFGTLEAMDVQAVIDRADHPWFNQTLVQVGDVLVRLGVFAPGSFHWHQHDEQDEFFFVLDGRLRIELAGRTRSAAGVQRARRAAAPPGGPGRDLGDHDRTGRHPPDRRSVRRAAPRQVQLVMISAESARFDGSSRDDHGPGRSHQAVT